VGVGVGVGVGDAPGVGVGLGVAAETPAVGGQNPPETVIDPPLIGCEALTSPMVPATVILPPLLVPPPPAMTCGSTALIAWGSTDGNRVAMGCCSFPTLYFGARTLLPVAPVNG
jgi:hypothetical protein